VANVTQLPQEFHRFFWDCNPRQLAINQHTDQILTRLLDYGDLAAARWALKTYGEDRIRQYLLSRGRKTLSRKTIAFWRALLGLDDEPYLQTSSLERSRPFWNV
jgi:hypothetical protein